MSIQVDITFHPSWWHKNVGVCFDQDFFYNPDYRISADIKMRQVLFDKFGDLGMFENHPLPRPILGSDLIASGFLYSEILGCEVRYSKNNPPEVLCKNMNDLDIEKLKAPVLDNSEVWQKIEKQIEHLTNRFGYVEPNINLMGIQNIALDLRGSELFIDYHEKPELAHHLLKICTELSIDIGSRFAKLNKVVSGGVTAIVKKTMPDTYITSNCTVEMISLETYKEFLLPFDKKLSEAFKPFGIHHCGKTMEHIVDGYKLIEDLAFAEVGAFSDIGYVRKQLPNAFLNARYSPVKLKDVSDKELKSDIIKMIAAEKPYDELSVSCVGIDSEVSDEQVRKFLIVCKEM